MTFQEAEAALLAGQWVRRACFEPPSALFFFAHRNSLPEAWQTWFEDGCDIYTVTLDHFAYAHGGSVELGSVGPAGFSDDDLQATDWVVYRLPGKV